MFIARYMKGELMVVGIRRMLRLRRNRVPLQQFHHLSLPKTLYGANAFEINDIHKQETETSRVRPLQCNNVTLR